MTDTSAGEWTIFGRAVKDARIAAGLSQAELGQPTFSRSYVSLLEAGVRAPSEAVIAHLSHRLGLSERQVREWALAAGSAGAAESAIRQAEALGRLSNTDLRVALQAASDLRGYALETDRLDLWWTATVMDLAIKIDHDQAQDVLDEARTLARHWLTNQSAHLAGRVRTLLATALRLTGNPEEAIREARQAVDGYRDQPGWPATAVAPLTVLVSVLGQQRRYAEALELVDTLARAAEDSPSTIDAGNAWWALGNLFLRTGRYDEGLTFYDKAADQISPNYHLRRWGRLQRAAAEFRLQAQIDLNAVPALLDNAETAFRLSSAESDRAELQLTQARHAAHLGDHQRACDLLLTILNHENHLMPDERADAHQLLAATFTELGDHEQAAQHLQRALALLSPSALIAT